MRNDIARTELRPSKQPPVAFREKIERMETDWIRDGLKQTGKSQAGLARWLHLTPPQVTRMLTGRRRIKADEVIGVMRR